MLRVLRACICFWPFFLSFCLIQFGITALQALLFCGSFPINYNALQLFIILNNQKYVKWPSPDAAAGALSKWTATCLGIAQSCHALVCNRLLFYYDYQISCCELELIAICMCVRIECVNTLSDAIMGTLARQSFGAFCQSD